MYMFSAFHICTQDYVLRIRSEHCVSVCVSVERSHMQHTVGAFSLDEIVCLVSGWEGVAGGMT